MCTCIVDSHRITFANLTTDGGVKVNVGDVGAISIGPRSHVDRCYVMPEVSFRNPPPPRTLVESRHVEFPVRDIVEVSVERPFIGVMRGPLIVMLPFAMDIDFNAASIPRPWIGGLALGLMGDQTLALQAQLDLDFYSTQPHWLPTRRAPFEFVHRITNFGTGGVNTRTLTVPGWGRKESQLSIKMDGRTAGNLDWSVNGVNTIFHEDLNIVDIAADPPLQPVTTEAADFQSVKNYNGEFDLYSIVLAENGALNAGVTVDVIWKSWDRE